ncbi:hypothetical protein ACI2JW_04295 [Serratia ureilytica]|uniref:hypothetical protein n=1 Tax=Serratia ureilytica TaxID=300181 RepID=UPI00384CC7C7
MTLTTEKYTEGLCEDGAAILCDGVPMSVSEILAALNAANREAQPVAWHFPGSDTESAQLGYDHELDDEQKRNCIALYTAPPAPAVPEGCESQPVTTESLSMDKAYRRAEMEMALGSSARDIFRFSMIALLSENRLYTAPPAPAMVSGRAVDGWIAEAMLQKKVAEDLRKSAPAVPEEMTIEKSYENVQTWHYANGWNDCRAAMLAQPVSSGYKFVPVEPTEDMIAAAMNCDDVTFNADETFSVNFGNIYAAMLAVAPEGGN